MLFYVRGWREEEAGGRRRLLHVSGLWHWRKHVRQCNINRTRLQEPVGGREREREKEIFIEK